MHRQPSLNINVTEVHILEHLRLLPARKTNIFSLVEPVQKRLIFKAKLASLPNMSKCLAHNTISVEITNIKVCLFN